jgi:hypothetical protein
MPYTTDSPQPVRDPALPVPLELEHLREARKLLKRAQELLQFPIAATPTGAVRNNICDANIHIGAAAAALLNAIATHP